MNELLKIFFTEPNESFYGDKISFLGKCLKSFFISNIFYGFFIFYFSNLTGLVSLEIVILILCYIRYGKG